MSRVKWMLVVAALVLGSSPTWASSPFETQIVPAVLHLPGPGEEPLYTSIRFAEAPPALPSNRYEARCEAQCLAGFRNYEAECGNVICPIPGGLLLDLCTADCAGGV
jgi:hypothetical protein